MELAVMTRLFAKTPEQGANSLVLRALGMGNNAASKYCVDCKEQSLGEYAMDKAVAKKLWKESREKLKF
jgi:hypothetical protein